MKAGLLNRRIEIQRKGGARDGWGQLLAQSWLPHLQLWAHVRRFGGPQDTAMDAPADAERTGIRTGTGTSTRMRVRYRQDIQAGMRAVQGRTVYEIVAVVPDEERREHMDLLCKVLA
jgi:SPP1 family predicted phage head-tail adaptor